MNKRIKRKQEDDLGLRKKQEENKFETRDSFWQNFCFQQRYRLGVKGAEERRREINKIWFTRSNKVTAGIFHGRSRLRARSLIDTDVTDTLTTLKNFTALRFVDPSEQRLCETKDRFGNGLTDDFEPALCESFCVSYETPRV